MDYQQSLKRVAHNLIVSLSVDEKRRVEMEAISSLVAHHLLQLSHVMPQMGPSQIKIPRASQVYLHPLFLYYRYALGIVHSL